MVVKFKRKTIQEYLNPSAEIYEYIPVLGEIVVELPTTEEELEAQYGKNYLYKNIYKFKIGDGVHNYGGLKYEEGTIPAACNLSYGWKIYSKPPKDPEE